jgi:Arm domain-containing DNA-binding protein
MTARPWALRMWLSTDHEKYDSRTARDGENNTDLSPIHLLILRGIGVGCSEQIVARLIGAPDRSEHRQAAGVSKSLGGCKRWHSGSFSMTTDTNDEWESETQPDLVWDKEAPGLCVRVYGDGSKSFIFVYRVDDCQRFVRIGKSPVLSLEAARKRAKELRAVIDQGGDPEIYNQERDKVQPVNYETNKVRPVEDVIRYIAEQLGRES